METHDKIRLMRELNKWSQEDASVKLDLLKMELKHCKEMLEQKDKEIELLRKLIETV